MKMRQLKHLKRRVTVAVKAVAKVVAQPVTLYQVIRRKDNELVNTVRTLDEANALVLKAKASKKASLYVNEITA